jgi:hypothetical protein
MRVKEGLRLRVKDNEWCSIQAHNLTL